VQKMHRGFSLLYKITEDSNKSLKLTPLSCVVFKLINSLFILFLSLFYMPSGVA